MGATVEVARDAVPEVACLADVEETAVPGEHAINARLAGQRCQEGRDVESCRT
jgi:hypothetical protein